MNILDYALALDVGTGDVTSNALFSKNQRTKAAVIARDSGVLAGVEEAKYVFARCGAKAKLLKKDGTRIKKGDKIITVTGPARAVLKGERTALNILSRMSGIATETSKLARYCIVAATRKTAPGLALLDKKAVEIGGGISHRLGLWDMTLIKDTHLDSMKMPRRKAIREALKKAKPPVEIEVANKAEALLAASLGADIVMLDNFSPANAKATVKELNKNYPDVCIELSGGINEKNIREFAKAGADYVSLGALTHTVKPLDFSMKIEN
ncbi:MAG: carboxylating nicotinate-nucleotide diphosphorylase [Candidatus Diapherotrites archaeon]|nr:carboxylating nicotinate-nucleotide diphosphorylase [Candidatus Diapherotrites archaeon]